MKKVIAAVLGLTMLTSSVAFAAEETTHSQLSAFKNVKTSAVSTEEMNEVSGEVAYAVVFWPGVALVALGGYALYSTYCWGSGRC